MFSIISVRDLKSYSQFEARGGLDHDLADYKSAALATSWAYIGFLKLFRFKKKPVILRTANVDIHFFFNKIFFWKNLRQNTIKFLFLFTKCRFNAHQAASIASSKRLTLLFYNKFHS